MKSITVGRSDCDLIIQDPNVSRKHAIISLVNGQYVYQDVSRNGTTIQGKVYLNEKVVVSPGTPIYLSNKVPLPWPQVLVLLPNSPVIASGPKPIAQETYIQNNYRAQEETLGAGWIILSFLFPLIGWILYFIWKEDHPSKASQAAKFAWIGFAINLSISFITALSL